MEAGSGLAVNNEVVKVTGDETFKHFTRSFPAPAHMVHCNLKMTDLAGRTRTCMATYNFSPHGWEN